MYVWGSISGPLWGGGGRGRLIWSALAFGLLGADLSH